MLFLIISFVSSVIGAICGIGGGVIVKPVLDMFQLETISTINFLSSSTVLSMSFYSVIRNLKTKNKNFTPIIGLPLVVGASIGGFIGKQLFSYIERIIENSNKIGLVQAVFLGIITIGTLLYIIFRQHIRTLNIKNIYISILIGLLLGMISSFLGIGGGPINLVVLYYFFKMDTKTAATYSLFIILFSQITSIFTSIITETVPEFQLSTLILMVAGGIGGGMVGRYLNKKMNNRAVDYLLIVLMIAIIGVCISNAMKSIALL